MAEYSSNYYFTVFKVLYFFLPFSVFSVDVWFQELVSHQGKSTALKQKK